MGGAPTLLDPQAQQEYVDSIKGKHLTNESKKANIQQEVMPFIRLAQESQERREHAPTITSVDKRTISSTEKSLDIVHHQGRTCTQARQEAVHDPRNAVTHAVALPRILLQGTSGFPQG
jgi:predicted metal-dependent hydrolase